MLKEWMPNSLTASRNVKPNIFLLENYLTPAK